MTSDDSGNFLTFSSDENLDAVFLRQWRESLAGLPIAACTYASGRSLSILRLTSALRVKHLALLTISSGAKGTTVYVDGKLASSDAHFRIHLRAICTETSSWELHRRTSRSGTARFAVSQFTTQEIFPAQAAAHYRRMDERLASPAANAENANHLLARYDFRERRGTIIRSAVESGAAAHDPGALLSAPQAIARFSNG